MTVERRFHHRDEATGASTTIAARIAATAKGADLVAALAASGCAMPALVVDGQLVGPDHPLGSHQLAEGAVLGGDDTHPGHGLHLVALTGSQAGRTWRLGDDELTIGRDPTAEVRVDAPSVSRRHVALTAAGTNTCIATDLSSTNGTLINGRRAEGASPLRSGDVIGVADARFLLVHLEGADVEPRPIGADGLTPFSRHVRPAPAPIERRVTVPPRPSPHRVAETPLWQALLTAVPMLAFFLVLGRALWLVPVLLLAPLGHVGWGCWRRRQSRRRFEAEEVAWSSAAAAAEARAQQVATELGRRDRLRAFPALAPAIAARARHARIWERRPGEADFLCIPVGLTDRPADVDLDGPAGFAPPRGADVPLEIDLTAHAIGIVGAPGPARAVARRMVLAVAAAHSPRDVEIVVAAPPAAHDDWAFVDWLPHRVPASLATSSSERARLMRRLRTRLDAPVEHDPWLLVVVDTPGQLLELDIERIASTGRAARVALLVTGPERAAGMTATVTLDRGGRSATYAATDCSPLGNLRPLNLGRAPATDAAAAIARLRPDHSAVQTHSGRLFDQIGLDECSAPAILERWRRREPADSLNATIGVASGALMSIDLVADGPHAMIGGTTGSGKSELLKTLFASLISGRHPDDLALVVLDFKGGIDFDHLRGVPHLLDLATNQDSAGFSRTVTLLAAEVERRQRILVQAGVTNLSAYHERRRLSSLPALPRLVLVVDEFSVLLDSDVGRENLTDLVNVARIGRALGIHLVLVTQEFDHKLPDQINANTSLRICLKASERTSKTVLGSTLASSMGDCGPGWGFVAARGRAPVRFRASQVTLSRASAAETHRSSPVEVWISPTGRPSGPAPSTVDDTEFEDTDLAALCRAATAAARAEEWRPTVPWPAALPDRLPADSPLLATVQAEVGRRSLCLGIADLPCEQRLRAVGLQPSDDCVLFLGERPRELEEQVLATALRLASTHAPDELHLAGIAIDGDGLSCLAELPHNLGVATANPNLARRILRQLIQEAGARKLASARSPHRQTSQVSPPRLLLCVTGFDRLLRRGGDPDPLLAPMRTLLSVVEGTGIQVLISGAPTIADRLGRSVAKRFLFDSGRRDHADISIDGRCIDLRRDIAVQMARLSPAPAGEAEAQRAAVAAIAARPTARVGGPSPVVDVPWPLPVEIAPPPPSTSGRLLIGVETETGQWFSVPTATVGSILPVVGRRGSGRSNALELLARSVDAPCQVVVDHLGTQELAGGCRQLVGTVDDACELLDGYDGPAVVLIDDLHQLPDPAEVARLTERPHTLCIVAGPPGLLHGLGRSLRGFRAALVLSPTSQRDGSPITSALPGEIVTGQAGRGAWVAADDATGVQVPMLASA